MKNILAAVTIPLILASNPLFADVALTFGVYTSDKPTAMVKMFRPILNALETRLAKKLGEPVRITLQVANTYERGIDDLVSGQVDFARMGPASYILAKERNPDLQLLAMESNRGSKIFYGIICVHEQSPIEELSQLKGRTFAFGNEHSTIGRYLSQHLLVKQGLHAGDLSGYQYLDRHDKVGAAVATRRFEAGALKESTFKKLKAKGMKIRELARFPNVTKPWIASGKMGTEMVAVLRESLLGLKDPAALKSIKKDGFLPAEESDYAIIRESMQKNDTFFQ
ncbi:MAG: PhnD/SsuA/transferrin family substrate-binding protein [Candidatus Thiodiazotropha sp. (ex Dulcina madagascariensis)]|nr:PhnD/SsuA/transferrin family substrate-binding protein [Candidatus Thiodiazotropha sp. (ex Dulcina madagascariensis)]MCU7928540.1 PhnD/SsuA/transferrin family substrate-binding protein [Candidatus Thiodiazotropha sp. (ex Dulcina madagascariensis)]